MITRLCGSGLLFLATACATQQQGTVEVFQDCGPNAFCTDVQVRTTDRQAIDPKSEWPSYGHTAYGERHSPLTQIDTSNVAHLEVPWRFHTGEGAPEFSTRSPTALEATPLVYRGTMYIGTPLGRVFALDPVTGR